MADIAHLGLSVEYQDADKAALALTRMSAAAKKAEDAAAGVAGASSKAAKAAATITAGTSKARIEWETYDEVVARTGSKIKDAAQSADDAAKSVKGHGEAANDAGKGMENASLAAQGFSVALGKVKEVIAGFVLNAVTVAVGVLIAELAKLVDWAQWAKAALHTLADAIEAVAPYAAMAAAGLALIYAPAILAGLQAVTLGILSAAKAVGTLAIALVAANPGAAFVLGITAAVAAANIFRDELAQIFGRDIVKDVKDGVNTIIGAMVGAYDAVVAVWKALPDEFGRLGKMAANALLDGLGSLTIDWKNPFTGNVTRLVDFDFSDLKQKVDEVEAGAEKVAQAAYQARQGVDYVGEIGGVVSKGASAAADKLRALADGLGKTEKAKKKAKSEAEKLAEKYDRLVASATEFIRAQELEASVLGMTEQAANALRYEQDLLNEARRAGLKLTDSDRQGFKALAEAMAEAEERTRVLTERFDFMKDLTRGLFTDIKNDLISNMSQGMSFWDAAWKAMGKAALNVLDKIVDKLLNDVLDAIFKVNSNSGSGGGGILGFLGGLFKSGGGGGGGALTNLPLGAGLYAKGGVFDQSGVTAFAKGGIVERATVFPFAKGIGLMGEAGPEAIMPLRRGADGRLGVSLHGAANQNYVNQNQPAPYVDNRVYNFTGTSEEFQQFKEFVVQRDAEFDQRAVGAVKGYYGAGNSI